MAEAIRPFHRSPAIGASWILRVMRVHFALAGIVLFLGALAIAGSLYAEFDSIALGWDLRIEQSGKIYESGTQIKLIVALLLGGASLLQFQAVRSGPGRARAAALMLLAGFPLGWLVWNLELDVPGLPVTLLQTVLRIGAILLIAQAVLSLVYLVRLFSHGVVERLTPDGDPVRSPLTMIRRVVIGLWLVAVVALAVTFGVMTDWLYEFSVPVPDPGDMLYATSFDSITDQREWDTYTGRDAAQIVAADDVVPDSTRIDGRAMTITYGSPYSNQVVFSSLDRKFNDLDLRVTALPVSGPMDNQYGVFFRYRDRENYYGFFVSSDGYYSLVKREDGMFHELSAWGQSEAIHQGNTANEIRIVARGDTFQFFVNGQPMPLCLKGDNLTSLWNPATGKCATADLTTVYQDSDFKQGRVALAAGSSVDLSSDIVVVFDDLIIVGPDE